MSTGSTPTFPIERHPNPTSAEKRAELLANPGFGKIFTDYMVTIHYTEGQGWHDARIEPRKALEVDPAMLVLHYAHSVNTSIPEISWRGIMMSFTVIWLRSRMDNSIWR